MNVFLLAFVFVYAAFMVSRIYYQKRRWGTSAIPPLTTDSDRFLVRLSTVSAVCVLAGTALGALDLDAELLAPVVQLPLSVQRIGALIASLGMVVLIMAHRALGSSWRLAAVDTSTRSPLVTAGPYRWIRHPMYLGLGLVVTGLLLIMPSPPVIFGTCLGFAAKGALAAREEEHLFALYSSEYEQYRRGTWRFLPLGRRS